LVSALEKINSRIHTERLLKKNNQSFTAAFLNVQYIESCIDSSPENTDRQTFEALMHVLKTSRYDQKKQAYFLFKKTAQALVRLSVYQTHPLKKIIIEHLQKSLFSTHKDKHRAVSEALGELPINIKGPNLKNTLHVKPLKTSLHAIVNALGLVPPVSFEWIGRTLVGTDTLKKKGCLKFIRQNGCRKKLSQEILWLNFLKNAPCVNSPYFQVPDPLFLNGHHLFKIDKLPLKIPYLSQISPQQVAIAYKADKDYFNYPNLPEFCTIEMSDRLVDIFKNNARLLGLLSAEGILHTALIPLFHNRIQQARRQDLGVYNWEQGGRLDQWLKSSHFPNFSISGLRDFEHFRPSKNSAEIRHFIGQHLLSLILVAGSCFRNRAPEKIGVDDNHQPLDIRYLFDTAVFEKIIKAIVEAYYCGLTGQPLEQADRLIEKPLVHALINAMGIDTHMEEILRSNDQAAMTNEEFHVFLSQKGMDKQQIDSLEKGGQDIVLHTGPHLGGFNQNIDPPELTHLLFCLSALCISDRYLMENRLKAHLN
jgi:hypothetical protein